MLGRFILFPTDNFVSNEDVRFPDNNDKILVDSSLMNVCLRHVSLNFEYEMSKLLPWYGIQNW